MTSRVLISGSVAYDTIMVFEGRFKDHILPERVHMLNVSFLTPGLKREFGGCAANIAFNLKALGGHPAVLASVGRDGDDYLQRLQALGIDTTYIRRFEQAYTAQAFITTDLDDNQITAFHPGAMNHAHEVPAQAALPARWGIVAPNGKAAMLAHARAFGEAGLPWIFDPGQGLPMFDGSELRALIESATAVAVNDYESRLLTERTGWNESEIASKLQALVITRGGEGSTVHTGGQVVHVPALAVRAAVDPTGCGDAYRGGLLYALAQGHDWIRAAKLGAVMGAIKIEHAGPQNHSPSPESVASRYEAAWGEPFFG
jgi:adenosine kinase